jgi:hypothetical protein
MTGKLSCLVGLCDSWLFGHTVQEDAQDGCCHARMLVLMTSLHNIIKNTGHHDTHGGMST